MTVSLKCQYALQALLILAKRNSGGMTRITEIAADGDIPPRYLENICNQLRQGGFIEGKRGKDGGFALMRDPRDITVGDVIRFLEGPIHPTSSGSERRRYTDGSAILRMWDKAALALESVYDTTSLKDLLEDEIRRNNGMCLDYSI